MFFCIVDLRFWDCFTPNHSQILCKYKVVYFINQIFREKISKKNRRVGC